jgi:hypothetical protein
MTFNRDFETLASIAKDRQDHILRLSAQNAGHAARRPGGGMVMGVFLAVVGAPLAALFFIQVW